MKPEELLKEANLLQETIVSNRRYLHSHAETGFDLKNTLAFVKKELIDMGYEPIECGKAGLIALAGGKKEGKVFLIRGDMDALPIKEESDVEFSCQSGKMHACGHDAHMASLIGAAMILKKYEENLLGKIILIFQPSEENSLGAKLISEQGYLDDVDEIFGLHVFGDIECGKISIEEGPRMAASNKFRIKVTGKAGHAGKPHQCVDATLVSAAIVMNLQSIVSREIDPVDSAVVTVGHIKSGDTHNIISGEAIIEGTVRSFKVSTAKHIQQSIKRVAYSTAIAYGATATVEYDISNHPAVINDSEAVKTALEGAKKIFKEEDIISVPRMMLGEDFSIYQKSIPGVFAFVGASNEDIGIDYPNHNDKFNIDEKAILISTELYVAYALEALKKEVRRHVFRH